jgi:hypothetical protein
MIHFQYFKSTNLTTNGRHHMIKVWDENETWKTAGIQTLRHPLDFPLAK